MSCPGRASQTIPRPRVPSTSQRWPLHTSPGELISSQQAQQPTLPNSNMSTSIVLNIIQMSRFLAFRACLLRIPHICQLWISPGHRDPSSAALWHLCAQEPAVLQSASPDTGALFHPLPSPLALFCAATTTERSPAVRAPHRITQ